MDPQEFEQELEKHNSGSENANFITQIFYLSLEYFKLGPLRLIQEYGTSSREFNEIEQEMKRLEETKSAWSVQPNAPMILRFMEKLRTRMRELVDLRISHDFHLTNGTTKKSTVALFSFFLSLYKTFPGKKERLFLLNQYTNSI